MNEFEKCLDVIRRMPLDGLSRTSVTKLVWQAALDAAKAKPSHVRIGGTSVDVVSLGTIDELRNQAEG